MMLEKEILAELRAIRESLAIPDRPYITERRTILSATDEGTYLAAQKHYVHGWTKRNIRLLYVFNEGPGKIYLISSSDGKTFDQKETLVSPGDVGAISNVYTVHIRTDVAGTTYRLSEYLRILGEGRERWGRDVFPDWVHAAEQTAPVAATVLVTQTVTAGKTGYIYGFFISAQEANDFLINFTTGDAAKSIRIPLSTKGAVHYIDFAAMNEGMGADAGTAVTITNVSAATAGKIYQARLLYAEV